MKRGRAPRGPWCDVTPCWDGTEVRFGGGDEYDFRVRLDDLKDRIPSPGRRYDPDRRVWWVSDRYAYDLRRWRAEWFTGSESWSPPPPRPAPSGEAYRDLHLLPSAPPELVKAAYRVLATLHHPDRGGSTETMQRINLAYEQLGKGAA